MIHFCPEYTIILKLYHRWSSPSPDNLTYGLSGDYHQDVHEILIRIENLFTSKVDMPATSENIGGGSTQQIVHISPENASRLPKFTLPHFSGDPVDWIHFCRDSFSAAVDKKTSLSNIEKFTYLQSVLEGEVAAAIAGLSLTATNYKNAVELLTQRFGKDTVIISSYMKNRLMKISPLKSGADNKKLRAMLDEIDSSARGLQSMKVSNEHYGGLLDSVLLNDKFPDDIKLLTG